MVLAIAGAVAGLRLDRSPGQESCPASAEVEGALATRQVVVPGGAADEWRLWYHREATGGTADAIRMQLYGPDRELRLERVISVVDGQCEAAAPLLAAILHRFFKTVVWSAPPRPPRAALASERAPPPAVVRVREPDHRPRVAVAVGPGLVIGTKPAACAVLDLSVSASLARGFRLGLSAGLLLPPLRQEESVSSADRARLTRWPLRFSAVAAMVGTRLGIEVGPAAHVFVESARSESIPDVTQRRVSLAVGGTTRVLLFGPGRWSTGLELGAYHGVITPNFFIDQTNGRHTVLAPPAWWALVALSVAYSFFPGSESGSRAKGGGSGWL